MKAIKKLLALALAALMLLSLSACGMSDLPLIKAALKLVQLNNLHIDPEGELGMSINIPAYGMDMNLRFTAEGGVDYCADPLGFSADLRVHAMDEDLRLLAYGEDRSGDFVVEYSTDGGASWEEETLGKTAEIAESISKTSDLSLSDIIALGKNLGGAFSGFAKAGQERVNGQSATRYDAGFSLRTVVESEEARKAFLEGMAEAMRRDADELAGMIDLSTLEDLQLSLWLNDADARIVKLQLDLTDAMHSLLASGRLDSVMASQAGLEGIGFSMDVSSMRLALTLSNFDGVGRITRPRGDGAVIGGADAPTDVTVSADTALQPRSTWLGTVTIQNHAGQGSIENGDYDVWGVLDTAGGQTYFELFDAEDASNSEASPVMSFWAEVDGARIVPLIDPDAPEEGWLLNIYLSEADANDLVFTLEDGVLSASYFYYDADKREACDIGFVLTLGASRES